jgi:two-component system, NarL family, nitrate/nitrite response regulator NarL
MKVAIVGTLVERARLRAQLNGTMTVVGEFDTMAAARAAAIPVDAILVAPATEGAIQEALTAREIEVLELMAEGLANKAIAARLGISDQTVKFHVAAILGKLDATNRTEAVRRAVRRGLVTL